MNEKETKLIDIIKALCPPVIYMFITMLVEVIVCVAIFASQAKNMVNNMSFISSYEFIDNINDNINKYSYLITFIAAGVAALIFGYKYFRSKNHYEKYGIKKMHNCIKGKDYLYLMMIGVAGSVGLSRLVSMLPLDNIIGNYEQTSETLLTGNIVLQIVSLGIVVPIAEEIIYRGILFTGLTKIMEEKYSIFVTSLVFGIFHYNLLQGTYTFLLSLVLICLYMKYKCILVPIIVHGLANITAVISSYYGISEFLNNNIWIYLLLMCIELAIGIVGFQMIMKKENKR